MVIRSLLAPAVRRTAAGLVVAATCCACFALASAPARAQSPVVSGAARYAAGFFDIGGYFFTDSSARHALGSSKFYGASSLFVRPKHLPGVEVTGGFQIVGAADHFFPFSSGDSFNLYGAAARAITPRKVGAIRPYVDLGLYLGHIRSFQAGIETYQFTPSAAFGIDYPFTRYLTFNAGYRVSGSIAGINPDGFFMGLRFF